MIIGSSGSRKTNTLLNLIKEQGDIVKIYLYAKDLSELKYEFLTKKLKDVGIRYCNVPNAFVDCSNRIEDVYENINNYNPNGKRKILIVLDDMIAHIINEFCIRCRKLNISLVFITQSYFSVPKHVRSNSTHYLIAKINDRKELQNIAINHPAGIDYNNFVRIYKECTRKLYSFLTADTTLPARDPLRFRKNLLPSYKADSNSSA